MGLYLREDRLDRVLQLDLGRMKERVHLFRLLSLHGGELDDVDPGEIPAVRVRRCREFFGRFGKRDVKPALTAVAPLEEELHREGRLAGARLAVEQIEAIARKSAAEDVIQSTSTNERAAAL